MILEPSWVYLEVYLDVFFGVFSSFPREKVCCIRQIIVIH